MTKEEKQKLAKLIQKKKHLRELDPLQLYTPYGVQELFHRSESKVRLFCGGNRTGKTTAGIIEDLWWLTGRHPYQDVPVPCKGLLVGEDFPSAVAKVLNPKLMEWLPRNVLKGKPKKNQQGIEAHYEFMTGSILDIMVYEQEVDKFEGSDYDFVHFDEPPPRDIWIAVLRGLTDRNGRAWFCMTPLKEAWIFDELWEPGLLHGGKEIVLDEQRIMDKRGVGKDKEGLG